MEKQNKNILEAHVCQAEVLRTCTQWELFRAETVCEVGTVGSLWGPFAWGSPAAKFVPVSGKRSDSFADDLLKTEFSQNVGYALC